MLSSLRIRSRIGNVVIGAAGALLSVASAVLLIYYLAAYWDSSGLVDRALQVLLLFAVVIGFAIGRIALANLRESRRPGAAELSAQSHASQRHREAAANAR